MTIKTIEEFNAHKDEILLDRSYYVGHDHTQHPGADLERLNMDLDQFFQKFSLQVITADTISVKIKGYGAEYPLDVTWFTRSGRAEASLATGQTMLSRDPIRTPEDFLDFIESIIEEGFSLPQWADIFQEIITIIENDCSRIEISSGGIVSSSH